MKSTEFITEEEIDIKITDRHENSFRGGYEGTLLASASGNQIGYLSYSIYQDVPAIKMIWVEPEYRRFKVARKLLKALQEMSPEHEIEWGYTTDEGNKLRQSIDFIKRPNIDIIKKKEKLKAVKSKLAQLNHRLELMKDKNPELVNKYIITVSDKWNKLNDLEYRLENELFRNSKEYQQLIPENKEN